MEPGYDNLAEYFDMLEEPMKSYFYNLLKTCVDLQQEIKKDDGKTIQAND